MKDAPIFDTGASLAHILPHSVQMRENTDQSNSEYGQLLRSVRKQKTASYWLKRFPQTWEKAIK